MTDESKLSSPPTPAPEQIFEQCAQELDRLHARAQALANRETGEVGTLMASFAEAYAQGARAIRAMKDSYILEQKAAGPNSDSKGDASPPDKIERHVSEPVPAAPNATAQAMFATEDSMFGNESSGPAAPAPITLEMIHGVCRRINPECKRCSYDEETENYGRCVRMCVSQAEEICQFVTGHRAAPTAQPRGTWDPDETPEQLKARIAKVEAFVESCQPTAQPETPTPLTDAVLGEEDRRVSMSERSIQLLNHARTLERALSAAQEARGRAERHAGHTPSIERIREAHSHMSKLSFSEVGQPCGHRVYRQDESEQCYLCALLMIAAQSQERERVMREALENLLHQVERECERNGEGDFETAQARAALASPNTREGKG